MTLTIWKYECPVDDEFELSMPVHTTILSVQTQNETPCIWAMVNPSGEREWRTFITRGTGHPINNPDGLVHVGSYQLVQGRFVGHIFERVDS